MRKCIISSLLLFCLGCNDRALGDGFFHLPKYESEDVGYPYGTIVYHGKTEYDYRNILVLSDVLYVIKCRKFILVKQKPNIELYYKYLKEKIKYSEWKIPKYLYNDVNYIIIDKSNSKTSYFPSLEKFKKECERLEIETEFIIKDKW